jgi:NitT/TauT family transport system permease protein
VRKGHRYVNIIAPILAFICVFGAWEAICIIFNVQTWILPAPSLIFQSMIVNFPEYWPHILATSKTIAIGFLIAIPVGLLVASLVTNFKLLSDALSPYIIFLVTTPIITLVPLLQLAFGYGMNVRVITVVIQSFAVVNMNACTGFLNVPIIRLELMQSLGATKLQAYRNVIFPSAATDIFTGISLAGIFSTTACISAEYIGGNEGLGSRIITYSRFLKSDQSFACIFYVMILGIILYCIVKLTQKLIVKWSL